MKIEKESLMIEVEGEQIVYASSYMKDKFGVNCVDDLQESIKERVSINDYNYIMKGTQRPYFHKVITIRSINNQEEKVLCLSLALSYLNQNVSGHFIIFVNNSEEEVEFNEMDYDDLIKDYSLDRVKEDFITNVSHELRTPLHSILSYSQFGIKEIIKIDENHNIKKYFDHIHKNGLRMLKLVEDLLDISKMESNKLNYIIGPEDLIEILESSLSEMKSFFEKTSITYKIIDHDAPRTVYVDRFRIIQVIKNLIQNSLDFSPKGSNINFCISKDVMQKRKDEIPAIKFTIEDEGIGVDNNEHEMIFDKFTQGSRTITGSGGSGLGLPLAKKIIEDHGGKIFIESLDQDSKVGCCMSFILPIEVTF